jgi:hypothetical protein
MTERKEKGIASIRLIVSGGLTLNSVEQASWTALLKQVGIDATSEAVFINAAVEAIKESRNDVDHHKNVNLFRGSRLGKSLMLWLRVSVIKSLHTNY